MSVWDYKDEVIRWINSPKGTKVWVKQPNKPWILVPDPQWYSGIIYIVDDKHAKMRKEWIDKGKPPVEWFNEVIEEWRPAPDDPHWVISVTYRIRPDEWDTPEGEDPITYHAKRLCNKGGDWYIAKSKSGEYYAVHFNHSPLGSVTMEEEVAFKISKALNSGKLKETK